RRWSRLAAKVIVPTRAATATVTARTELRTGTPARPLPGSIAMRTPALSVGGRAAAAMARARTDGRPPPATPGAGRRSTAAARQTGQADTATTSPSVAAAPRTSTHRSTITPGWTSATRAVPIRARGEATT